MPKTKEIWWDVENLGRVRAYRKYGRTVVQSLLSDGAWLEIEGFTREEALDELPSAVLEDRITRIWKK